MTITSNPLWTDHGPPMPHRTRTVASAPPPAMTIQITVHGPDAVSALAPLVDAVRALDRADVTIDTWPHSRPPAYGRETGVRHNATLPGAAQPIPKAQVSTPHPGGAGPGEGIALRILRQEHIALLDGEPLALPRREYDLLVHLVTHPRRVFTRTQLLRSVWGYEFDSGGRTVDVHVRRLRQKLGDRGPSIVTVRGVGYRLDGADQVQVIDSVKPEPITDQVAQAM